ncbi:MAG: DUF4956 domain-containing protein [Lachnospiraceae bacterium]|nr:DUF4956 domain-containing protein [Lachnospiraceae bacterium]
MSVRDVIKKSVLESSAYNQAITGATIFTFIVDLLLAFFVGLLIYAIYRKFYHGVVFSKNFGMSLVGMCVLTCMVTLAISTNVVISLGMVGALSIVRYRTAIKEPLDLMYLFWAIGTGIAMGASMYILVGLSFLIMFLVVLCFSRHPSVGNAYIMVVHYQGDEAGDAVERNLSHISHTVRSKVMRGDETEMTVQLRAKNKNLSFAEKIRDLENVSDCTLLLFDGEYHS